MKKKSKHMKEEKNSYKIIIAFVLIAIIILLGLIWYKNKGTINYENVGKEEKRRSISEENINKENEKLVLKSNYEENREKKITYFFKENILDEVCILEKYLDEEKYINEKNKASRRADIELIKTDDEQLEIHYQKLRFGSDEGLSYDEIYSKYMGIIGAYEIINE